MKKIDTTPKLYSREDAERVAAEYQAGDPDWTYRAVLLVEERNIRDHGDLYAVEVLEAPEGEHIAWIPVDPNESGGLTPSGRAREAFRAKLRG